MVAIGDVLVVHHSGSDAAEPVAAFHVIEEGGFELFRVAINDTIRVLTEHLHLALVALTHAVALEPVLVTTLFLAHLAVPTEFLETFCLDTVGDCFRSQEFVLPHWDLEQE